MERLVSPPKGAATRKEYVALAIKYLGHRLAFVAVFLLRILL